MVVAHEVPTFEYLLTRSAITLLALGLVWAGVVVAAVLLEALSDGRVRWALSLGCPRWCHRWLLAALTAVVAAVALTPPSTAATASPEHALDGLALPDRPLGGPPEEDRRPAPRAQRASGVSEVVRVKDGESLWTISRSRLPPGTSAQRILTLTRTIYQRNRHSIGDDPDLITRGEHLIVPPTNHETYSEDS